MLLLSLGYTASYLQSALRSNYRKLAQKTKENLDLLYISHNSQLTNQAEASGEVAEYEYHDKWLGRFLREEL